MDLKQGRQKTPQAYYNRLRQAYFGAQNEPEMEEELNFRTLFLRNLHPAVSHCLGIMACHLTMSMQQLQDFAHKAYCKQKTASEKTGRLPTIHLVSDHHSEWTLEGAHHAVDKSTLSSEQKSVVTSESAEILRILKELLQ